ncbi:MULTISPECIES: assimilatory sulfite reductase (NADPH) flavoprotein subunit [unclassified Sporosarcina]|uniref:assimilatory sulfite reductase (NADPH) flavoprotein subunit n=1 Tax=unclassified Sporosarcina TaxID=2647733 RepID=UPI00203FDFF9|nr:MULTISPECIES: assimilatory sulfite reductase (NADPH) flavoprotein subunit [unclassified Sporosarcina]GKV65041.1 sulfite reductase [NADPH] flavoprotein alpha-component [Sporosarcina sp. NCCP-2331]GLB56918.1 sulfite reductase [NADPH] flavoprotein alpha-component [Sporosarcina sp. NCCP-2378]
MALQVTNSPFSEEQVELLNRLLPSITVTQQSWLSGYLTAVSSALNSVSESAGTTVAVLERPVIEVPAAVKEVTILFGSQTGNGQGIAEQAASTLKKQSFEVTLQSMSDFKPNNLKKIEHLLLVVSTHGEGDPPDTALPFYEFLHGRRAPKLDHLQYSVLALGDSSYEFFCKTGADFDQKLAELGAKPLAPRVDCDLDYDEPAAQWLAAVEVALQIHTGGQSAAAGLAAETVSSAQFSRTNPFRAEVLENINLNGRGSNKETRHLELSLEGSGLEYKPGDSVGIFPENNSELIDEIIKLGNWNADKTVEINAQGERRALRAALQNHFEITVLTKPLLEKLSHYSESEQLKSLLHADQPEDLRNYVEGRDLLDALKDFGPVSANEQHLVSILRKLPARLYSIASSFQANPDEVHLTIGTVRYEAHGRIRQGVCSVQCAENIEPGDKLPIYIHKNDNFRLPENPRTPIIMIGPGTGIAPFRSFIEERSETGAEGKSWLFFGDQHYVTDFYYQTEWQNYVKDGVLTRLDVAFSRDSAEKVYVQHRMKESSKELYQWIEEGASVYVCGDEQNMAKDVHHTLLEILQQEGGKSLEEAEQFITQLIQEKRYQRDVY